jgi:hypothetical protein
MLIQILKKNHYIGYGISVNPLESYAAMKLEPARPTTATGYIYISPQITTINFALISTVIHNIQRNKRTSYEFSLGTIALTTVFLELYLFCPKKQQ